MIRGRGHPGGGHGLGRPGTYPWGVMVKSLRKYNKWLMVGFSILLMLAWLGGPATRQAGESMKQKVVARVDGKGITAEQQSIAGREIEALNSMAPFLVQGYMGIKERDSTHWLLLTQEASEAGLVGESEDGKEFIPQLVQAIVQQELRTNFQLLMQIYQSQNPEQERQRIVEAYASRVPEYYRRHNMSETEGDMMMARAAGVVRLINSYRQAARVSEPLGRIQGAQDLNAAVVDYVYIPASSAMDGIADPDAAAFAAQFERFKGVKKGEGEFGIGYLLPRRVKLEWMKLDRAAIENAVTIDPVEARKKYQQNHPGKYPGEYAAERGNIERDMRTEAADRVMQDAHLIVQAEVLKKTRALDADPVTKHKKLPADWATPRYEAIAQAVVEGLKKNGITLPLPEVVVREGQWVTESELGELPGIGSAVVRQGGLTIPLAQLVSWTKELPDSQPGLFPVQINVPVVENFLLDSAGNRYFATILATKGESAPDSPEEIRETIVRDYKLLQAFEKLKGREEELRKTAMTGGLAAVAALFPAPVDEKAPAAERKTPEVKSLVRVTRESAPDPQINEASIRTALVDAASKLDPMTPYGQLDPEKAFMVLPTPKTLGVGVFRLQAFSPLTYEAYRDNDMQIVSTTMSREMQPKSGTPENPFSLANLLKRHEYIAGDKTIRSEDQLKRNDGPGEG